MITSWCFVLAASSRLHSSFRLSTFMRIVSANSQGSAAAAAAASSSPPSSGTDDGDAGDGDDGDDDEGNDVFNDSLTSKLCSFRKYCWSWAAAAHPSWASIWRRSTSSSSFRFFWRSSSSSSEWQSNRFVNVVFFFWFLLGKIRCWSGSRGVAKALWHQAKIRAKMVEIQAREDSK